MSFISYLPQDLTRGDLHQIILGAVSPRPIAFVSTINKKGVHNIAPYSFFNAISSNPPLLCFSVSNPADGRLIKDTLKNIQNNRECVINIVNHAIHRQMTLCSIAFNENISEFVKSGLTPIPSEIIKPFRLKQSPVQFECTIRDIFDYGKHAGAANLVICEVLKLHLNEDVLIKGRLRVDAQKLDVMGRLGRSEYVRVIGDVVTEVYQSVKKPCIGFDALSENIVKSDVLTGNQIAELASNEVFPSEEDIKSFLYDNKIEKMHSRNEYHLLAKNYLIGGQKKEALLCVLIPELIHYIK